VNSYQNGAGLSAQMSGQQPEGNAAEAEWQQMAPPRLYNYCDLSAIYESR